MSDVELEQKILDNTGSPISLNELHLKVKGSKTRFLIKIKQMIQSSMLREIKEGNRKLVVRIDLAISEEFENALKFQQYQLQMFRDQITERKNHFGKTSTWKKHKKGFKMKIKNEGITVFIPDYRPKDTISLGLLDLFRVVMEYVFGIISEIQKQKTLGLITKSVGKARIEKCEKVIENEFKKLMSENVKDSKAFSQFFKVNLDSRKRVF